MISRIYYLLFRDGLLFPFDLARERVGCGIAAIGLSILELDKPKDPVYGHKILDLGRSMQLAAKASIDDRWREIDSAQPDAQYNYKHLPRRHHKGLVPTELRQTHPGSRLTDSQMGAGVAGIVVTFHAVVGAGTLACVLMRDPKPVQVVTPVTSTATVSVEAPPQPK